MAREKENMRYKGLEGLTNAEVKVIKALEEWKYGKRPANAYFIALEAGLSEGHVQRCIRNLKHRGIVLGYGKRHKLNLKVIKDAEFSEG